jgi:hypothetical protein
MLPPQWLPPPRTDDTCRDDKRCEHDQCYQQAPPSRPAEDRDGNDDYKQRAERCSLAYPSMDQIDQSTKRSEQQDRAKGKRKIPSCIVESKLG